MEEMRYVMYMTHTAYICVCVMYALCCVVCVIFLLMAQANVTTESRTPDDVTAGEHNKGLMLYLYQLALVITVCHCLVCATISVSVCLSVTVLCCIETVKTYQMIVTSELLHHSSFIIFNIMTKCFCHFYHGCHIQVGYLSTNVAQWSEMDVSAASVCLFVNMLSSK